MEEKESELIKCLCDADYRERLVQGGYFTDTCLEDIIYLWEVKYK